MRAESAALRPFPFQLFAGHRGVRLLATLPGFAGLWDKEVPDTHLLHDRSAVICPEDGQPVPLDAELVKCPNGCGRWYLRGDRSVLSHRFPTELAATPESTETRERAESQEGTEGQERARCGESTVPAERAMKDDSTAAVERAESQECTEGRERNG